MEKVNSHGINSFVLKVLAIIAMTFNHAYHIWGDIISNELVLTIMEGIGGFTFPIMAYLLVVGYNHTSNVKRYMGRLMIFAIISQVPYAMFISPFLNILFTLFFGLLIFYLDEKLQNNRLMFYTCFVSIVCISLFCDWLVAGPIGMFLFYKLQKKGKFVKTFFPCFVMASITFIMTYLSGFSVGAVLYSLANCLSFIPLMLYNGRRGPSFKWFFYAYYPLHIAVLGIVSIYSVNFL